MSSNPVTRIRNAAHQKAKPELDEIAKRVRTRVKSALDGVIATGRDLIAAKKIVGHGNWLAWLEREFGWTSDKTAERFMSVAKLAGKFVNLSNLNVPASGVYLLAAPSTPDEVIEAVAKRSENGDRLTLAEVERMIAGAQEPKRRYVPMQVIHRSEKVTVPMCVGPYEPRSPIQPVEPLVEHRPISDFLARGGRSEPGERSESEVPKAKPPVNKYGPTPEESWRSYLVYGAKASVKMTADFTSEFGPEWKTFKATPEEITLAEQALETWRTVVETLRAAPPEHQVHSPAQTMH